MVTVETVAEGIAAYYTYRSEASYAYASAVLDQVVDALWASPCGRLGGSDQPFSGEDDPVLVGGMPANRLSPVVAAAMARLPASERRTKCGLDGGGPKKVLDADGLRFTCAGAVVLVELQLTRVALRLEKTPNTTAHRAGVSACPRPHCWPLVALFPDVREMVLRLGQLALDAAVCMADLESRAPMLFSTAAPRSWGLRLVASVVAAAAVVEPLDRRLALGLVRRAFRIARECRTSSAVVRRVRELQSVLEQSPTTTSVHDNEEKADDERGKDVGDAAAAATQPNDHPTTPASPATLFDALRLRARAAADAPAPRCRCFVDDHVRTREGPDGPRQSHEAAPRGCSLKCALAQSRLLCAMVAEPQPQPQEHRAAGLLAQVAEALLPGVA
jgi:hypothetical protein